MITLTLKHGNNEDIINSVLSTVEDICEEVDCNMVWGSSTPIQRQFLGISLVEMHAMKSASVQCFLTWCKIIQTA